MAFLDLIILKRIIVDGENILALWHLICILGILPQLI